MDWLTLEGEGLVDADLRIDRGQLGAGSRLQVPHVQAQVGVMGPSPASKLTTINSNATSSARWRDEEAAMAGDTRTP